MTPTMAIKRTRPSAVTIAEPKRLYARIAEEFPEADRPDDIPREWWNAYEEEVTARRGVRGYRTVDLMVWYGRQDVYDPEPDPVAVRRAVDFDPAVLERLTLVEWFEFIDTLVPMEWYKGEFVQRNQDGLTYEGDLRWEAFMRLPLPLQETIERAVMRARKEAVRDE